MQLNESIASLGIRKYTPLEIKKRYNEVLETINFPAKKGHEVIDTGIDLVTSEEWKKIPPGKVLGCAFAGTNWAVGLVEKTISGKLIAKVLGTKSMTDSPKIHTSESLAKLMAQTIVEATFEKGVNISEIKAVGIALGFSQINIRVKGGIDARLRPLGSGKGWNFKGKELSLPPQGRPSLGKLLISYLSKINSEWKVKYFAFKNDTQAVAEDGQMFKGPVLPIGLVFGTGMNGALKSLNLRLAGIPIKADPVMTRMVKLKLLPNNDRYQEYLIGGDYIKYRVAVALELLNEIGLVNHGEEIAKTLIESKDGGIISKIAGAKNTDEIKTLLRFDVNFSGSMAILQSASSIALTQAGQLMGTNIAALAVAAGYKTPNEAIIPVEGSVFWKGYEVKASAQKTIDQILPGNKLMIREAVGLRGVGKLALAQTAL